MREILFRGKRVDNGEWIEGDLRQLTKTTVNTTAGAYICNYDTINEDNKCYIHYKIDPETIGQFTGLLDKNGKRIFEGDIVRLVAQGGRKHKVWQIVYDIEIAAWLLRNGDNNEDYEHFYGALARANCEVIGNIHDNPELLET